MLESEEQGLEFTGMVEAEVDIGMRDMEEVEIGVGKVDRAIETRGGFERRRSGRAGDKVGTEAILVVIAFITKEQAFQSIGAILGCLGCLGFGWAYLVDVKEVSAPHFLYI